MRTLGLQKKYHERKNPQVCLQLPGILEKLLLLQLIGLYTTSIPETSLILCIFCWNVSGLCLAGQLRQQAEKVGAVCNAGSNTRSSGPCTCASLTKALSFSDQGLTMISVIHYKLEVAFSLLEG